MKNKLFNPQLVTFEQNASVWEDAIKKSCEKLIENRYVTDRYVDSIINVVNEIGPYFILLDNFALPHSNEFSEVSKGGLSLTILKEPVKFPSGRKVQVLCTLAATNRLEHLTLLQELVNFLQVPNIVERLTKVTSYQQLQKILEKS